MNYLTKGKFGQARLVKIRYVTQLEELSEWRMLSRRPTSIILELSDLPREELVRWQILLNQRLSACGCSEGAILLLASTIAYISYLLFTRSQFSSIGWNEVGIGFGIIFLASLLGKFLGLIRAQIQLSRLVSKLKAEREVD